MIHEIIKWTLIALVSGLVLFLAAWGVLGIMYLNLFLSVFGQFLGPKKNDKGKGQF